MLAFFCPKLKTINGQFFDEICSDFTVRVIQEAKAVMEPYVSIVYLHITLILLSKSLNVYSIASFKVGK